MGALVLKVGIIGVSEKSEDEIDITVKLDAKAVFELQKHTNLEKGKLMQHLFGKQIEILMS